MSEKLLEFTFQINRAVAYFLYLRILDDRSGDGLLWSARHYQGVSLSQGKDQKEALENIKEANIAWLWAEDKKAIANLPPGRTHELTVAI